MKKIFLVDCSADIEQRTVEFSAKKVSLTEQEALLLQYFVENNDRVISKEELLLEVWQIRKAPSKSRVISSICLWNGQRTRPKRTKEDR